MTSNGSYIFDLEAGVTRTSVTYPNRFGITISADLYLPADFDHAQRHAALVVGGPFGGVKEQGAGVYAHAMAKRGFPALAFDPAYNGYSGGEPHHLASPESFVEDYSAAVDYLGTRPFVDGEQVGAIGVCGSGGFALSAASTDRRIKAVASVVMYDIGRYYQRGYADSLTEEDRDGLLDAIAQQRYVDFESGTPKLTPRSAPLDFDENSNPIAREFGEFYSRQRGYHHNAISQFTITSAMAFMNFPLLSKIEWISPRPILFVAGEHAHSRYFTEDAFTLASEPKELHIVPDAGHVDLYDKTDLIPFDKLDEFFTKNLA